MSHFYDTMAQNAWAEGCQLWYLFVKHPVEFQVLETSKHDPPRGARVHWHNLFITR